MGDTPRNRQRDFDQGLERDTQPMPDDGTHGPAAPSVSSRHDRGQDAVLDDHEARLDSAEGTNAAQGARLGSIDKYVITPDEAAAEPGQNPASLKQRLRITVPYLNTSLTMGSGAVEGVLRPDDPTAQLHWPGFGVTTQGNVYLEAIGPAADSRVKIQTKGDMSLHSNENGVNIGGKTGVAVGTDMGATVIGNGGVMIAGGSLGFGTVNTGLDMPEGSQNPITPAWVTDIGKVASGIGAALAGVDVGVAATLLLRDRKNIAAGLKDVSHSKAKVATTLAALAGGVFSAGGVYYGVLGAKGGSAGPNAKIFAGTTIYGQSGLILGSTATAGFYSLMGTTIYSPASVTVWSNAYVGITAGLDLSLATKKGEFNADEMITIRGGKSAVFGSDDEVEIKAGKSAALHSGDFAFVGGDTTGLQGKSELWLDSFGKIYAFAPKVKLHAKDEGTVSVTNGVLGLDGKDGVTLTSPAKIVAAVDAFRMILEPSKAYIGRGPGKAPDPPALDALEEVEKLPANLKGKWNSAEYKAWRAKKDATEKSNKSKRASNEAKQKAHDAEAAKMKGLEVGITMTDGDMELAVKGHKIKIDTSKTKFAALVIQK